MHIYINTKLKTNNNNNKIKMNIVDFFKNLLAIATAALGLGYIYKIINFPGYESSWGSAKYFTSNAFW